MAAKKVLENLQENAHGTLVPVWVKPGSRDFAVGLDEWKGSLEVRLREKAKQGKANRELLEKLRGFFGADVVIVAGAKFREKKVLVKAPKQQLLERLSGL